MKMVWGFLIKHEFQLSALAIVGLYIGEYRMREPWMGERNLIVFYCGHLPSHPVWKKDKSEEA